MRSVIDQQVLIVEEDALVSLVVEDTVRECGFDVVAVASVDLAIAELERNANRFCALLTNVRTPSVASGWDVARCARQLCPAMAVIYMTSDSGYTWYANGVPNSILLQKPFANARLFTALVTLLK